MQFASTSSQTVELSRDFMLPPKLFRRGRSLESESPQNSNAGSRKNLEQSPQIDDQSEPIIVPKHADAVRHVFRRLFQEVVGVDRIRSDHLVGGDTDAKVIVLPIAAKRCDDNVL